MELETLMRHYHQLRQELATAYQELPWQSSRIDQIAEELSLAERALVGAHHLPRSLDLNAPLQS